MEDFKITPQQRGAITRAVNTLNRVRAELEKNNPDAPDVNWYLEDFGNLCLMSAETHTGSGCRLNPNMDRIVHNWDLENSKGGSWWWDTNT